MQPEDIDKLFRQRLQGHAPTPPADLWSRLEAELQPEQKKRPVMWLYSMAAAIALLLMVGAGWLLRGPQGPATGAEGTLAANTTPAARPATKVDADQQEPQISQEKIIAQATPSATPASTTPEAQKAPADRPTASTRLVASATKSPHPSHSVAPNTSAISAPAVAVASRPDTQPERYQSAPATPAPEQTLIASATPSPTTAAPVGPIEVEVHRQAETPVALAAAAPDRRPRLGGILRQVRNAVRGDQVSLVDAGLPETLTVQARVAGRTLSKTIQL
ncbi:hypothetical protein FY528_13115 [Hymenobacter lutimineralis]|uniref:Uncharacterized protein n=1 Tax=Hymenobacter lutimineralis TaxID=2606448 RepID=A0A5D6V156_9BACT|nr:hypothetical protein [Hymenobacter lutimineralis]TYZ08384.1 hypothetical protein FY528_13115 [Hymenobacter lutimineralis]